MSNLYQGSWTPKAVLIGREIVRLNCHLLSGKDVWSDIPLLLLTQTVLSLWMYYESPVFLTLSKEVSHGERKYSLLTTLSTVYYKYRHSNTKLLNCLNCFVQFWIFSREFTYLSRESKNQSIFIASCLKCCFHRVTQMHIYCFLELEQGGWTLPAIPILWLLCIYKTLERELCKKELPITCVGPWLHPRLEEQNRKAKYHKFSL